jgi:hypothetical protein
MTRITFDVPDEPRCQNAAAEPSSAPWFPDLSPQELVELAQRKLDAGDDRQWAAALWAATHKTFLDLAKSAYIDSNDLIEIAEALDQKDEARVQYYTGKLINGFTLREHSRSGALEDYWRGDVHQSAATFVKDCYAAAP